jgi:hypothetical protein
LLLVEQLRKQWRTLEAVADFDEAPCLRPEGLVLGAGTVLTPRRAASAADDSDDRLNALLAVAYGRPIADQAIGHVKAAAIRWSEGDKACAELHLALSRLARPDNPGEAARRLFMADGLMRAGIAPMTILEALDIEASAGATTAKYSPDQPRVPAGSGRASGEWTSGGGGQASEAAEGVGRPGLTLANITFPLPAAGTLAPGLDLSALSGAALSRLALFIIGLGESGALAGAVTVGGVVAAVGVAVIPSTGPKGRWVEIGGRGDLSYYLNPDEAALRIKYTTPDGVQHVFAATPGPGGDYRDPDGRVIARLVKAGAKAGIVVATAELVGADTGEPRVCPAPIKDNGGELGADYEDYAKALFNPGNPTPRGLVYGFINPKTGKIVKIDDCQQQSGTLGEYKGPNIEYHFLKKDAVWWGILSDMLDQADRQLNARGDRQLIWFFEEKPIADYMRKLFEDSGPKYQGIIVEWLPWPGKPKK